MSSLAAFIFLAVCSEVEGETRRLVVEKQEAFKPRLLSGPCSACSIFLFREGRAMEEGVTANAVCALPSRWQPGMECWSRKWSIRAFKEGWGRGWECGVKATPVKGSLGTRPHVASLRLHFSSVLWSMTLPEGSSMGKGMISRVMGSKNSSGISRITSASSCRLEGACWPSDWPPESQSLSMGNAGACKDKSWGRLSEATSRTLSITSWEQVLAGWPHTSNRLIQGTPPPVTWVIQILRWATWLRERAPLFQSSWATTAGEGSVASTGPKGGLALKPLWLNTTWLWFFNRTLPTKVNASLSGMDGSSGSGVRHAGVFQDAPLDKADVYISRPVTFWPPPAERSMLILQISTLKGKETVT